MKILTVSLGCFTAAALVLCIEGCANFSTQAFRAEQTSIGLAHAAYVGWTNYLYEFPGRVSPADSNAVKVARLRFAATAGTVDGFRAAYETNSSVKPQLTAALDTLSDQASNVVWLINYLKK